MPITSDLRQLRQEDQEFEARLSWISRLSQEANKSKTKILEEGLLIGRSGRGRDGCRWRNKLCFIYKVLLITWQTGGNFQTTGPRSSTGQRLGTSTFWVPSLPGSAFYIISYLILSTSHSLQRVHPGLPIDILVYSSQAMGNMTWAYDNSLIILRLFYDFLYLHTFHCLSTLVWGQQTRLHSST